MYVTKEKERQSYKEGYVFNRVISKDGTAVDRWGSASRTVDRVQVEITGDYDDVLEQVAILSPSTAKKPYIIRKAEGPWWTAEVNTVTYGDWVYTYSDDDSSSSGD